jgi:hypothetical protein
VSLFSVTTNAPNVCGPDSIALAANRRGLAANGMNESEGRAGSQHVTLCFKRPLVVEADLARLFVVYIYIYIIIIYILYIFKTTLVVSATDSRRESY